MHFSSGTRLTNVIVLSFGKDKGTFPTNSAPRSVTAKPDHSHKWTVVTEDSTMLLLPQKHISEENTVSLLKKKNETVACDVTD